MLVSLGETAWDGLRWTTMDRKKISSAKHWQLSKYVIDPSRIQRRRLKGEWCEG